MCMMPYLVTLQFLVTEGTYRCKSIIFLNLLCIEQVSLHTLLQLNQILHERMKIALFHMWFMEYLELSLDCWDMRHSLTRQHDGLVFILLINC